MQVWAKMNVWTCLLLKRSLRGLHALTLEQWILTRTVHATQTRVSASAVHDHSLTSLLAVPHPWRPVSSGQCRTPPAPYPMSSDCSKPLYLDGTLLYPGTYFSDPYIFAPYAVFRSYQRECVVYWYSIQQPLHRSGYASQRFVSVRTIKNHHHHRVVVCLVFVCLVFVCKYVLRHSRVSHSCVRVLGAPIEKPSHGPGTDVR